MTCRLHGPHCHWCRQPEHRDWRASAARGGMIPQAAVDGPCDWAAQPPPEVQRRAARRAACRRSGCEHLSDSGETCERAFPAGTCAGRCEEWYGAADSACPLAIPVW